MKAMYLESRAEAGALTMGEVPMPRPQAGEVLVKVFAAAVTPTEFQWYPTFHNSAGGPRAFPIVLGHEFSGVVAAVGPGVMTVKAGDEVYGLNDWFDNGAQAEYCVAPATAVARKPRLLDHVQAAATPISALTALQGLLEKVKLQPRERILIHGGAGGVGAFAVQLARWRGAHVLATTATANVDFVRALGAQVVFDYTTTKFEEVAGKVDVVFDCVGGVTLTRSWSALSSHGRLVTIATPSATATEKQIRDAFMRVRADGWQLAQITNLIDAGDLRVNVREVFPLAEAREAFAHAQQRGKQGKVVLKVGE